MVRIALVAIAVAPLVAACRLDPLVDDIPGASGHILAAGSMVPSAEDNPEVANQIGLNDGVDDKLLSVNMNVIPRGTGVSAGQTVRYWSFGLATRAPAPMFRFFRRDSDGATLIPLDHPAMVEAIPGERAYNPLHTIYNVVITAKYNGELITTTEALNDAVDLGLLEAPIATGTFVASPVVLPSVRLEVGDSSVPKVAANIVYGHGYRVGMFEFGGARGVQPVNGLLPSSDVSFLREAGKPAYDANRPIFQATVPPMTSTTSTLTYTPLSTVLNVDLASDTSASEINADGMLFSRDATGLISGTTDRVLQLQVTSSILVLPIQFKEGER